MHCWKENSDVLFKYLENNLDFKISFVIFANGRKFSPFLVLRRSIHRTRYDTLYSFEACDTEISNIHLCVKYLAFAIL